MHLQRKLGPIVALFILVMGVQAQQTVPAGDLGGHWPLDASTTTTNDVSGGNNTATLLNSPATVQAVKLMDLGARRATEPRLRQFASDLTAVRHTELTELRDILGAAKVPYVDNHAGHDMPGMPTEVELVALAGAPDFDAEFTRLARAHLTESATVAKSGATAVTHGATRAAAASRAANFS